MIDVIVIVDMQNDFISGPLGTPEAETAVTNLVERLKNCPNKENTLLLFTKDTHYDNYLDIFEGKNLPVKHCIRNTPGWSIDKRISSLVKEPQNYFMGYLSKDVVKSRILKDTFASEKLIKILKENQRVINSIEFCGVCTDICVISNALAARSALPEIPIYINKDCCAGTSPELHEAALKVAKSCQIEII